MKRKKGSGERQNIDLSGAWVTWTTVGFGIQIFALFAKPFPTPLGLVWGIGRGGRGSGRNGAFEVFGSFVAYFARRNGVRSKINEEILKQYCAVISGSTGPGEGEAFMRRTGYRYNPSTDLWVKLAAKEKVK